MADILSTLVSFGLPVASIIALSYINGVIIRPVVIVVFTMTLFIFLTLLTYSRRIEVFAATAGYVGSFLIRPVTR